jgi:hypothetical protein
MCYGADQFHASMRAMKREREAGLRQWGTPLVSSLSREPRPGNGGGTSPGVTLGGSLSGGYFLYYGDQTNPQSLHNPDNLFVFYTS